MRNFAPSFDGPLSAPTGNLSNLGRAPNLALGGKGKAKVKAFIIH